MSRVLTVAGAAGTPQRFVVAELLAGLPHVTLRADLHCVTTWSSTDLEWSGVPFADFEQRVRAEVRPRADAAWLLVRGLDGFSACLRLDDACAQGTLLADGLDGHALQRLRRLEGAPSRQGGPRGAEPRSARTGLAARVGGRSAAGSSAVPPQAPDVKR